MSNHTAAITSTDTHPAPGITVRRYSDGTADVYVGGWRANQSAPLKTERGIANAIARNLAHGAECAARRAA